MMRFVLALACFAACTAAAQADKPLATRDLDVEGIRAEVIGVRKSKNLKTAPSPLSRLKNFRTEAPSQRVYKSHKPSGFPY